MHLQYILLLIPHVVVADGRVGRFRGFVEAINNRDTSYVQNCNDDVSSTNSNSSGGFPTIGTAKYEYVGTAINMNGDGNLSNEYRTCGTVKIDTNNSSERSFHNSNRYFRMTFPPNSVADDQPAYWLCVWEDLMSDSLDKGDTALCARAKIRAQLKLKIDDVNDDGIPTSLSSFTTFFENEDGDAFPINTYTKYTLV